MKYLTSIFIILLFIIIAAEIEKYSFDNGIDIIYEYNPSYNISSISVFFDGGTLNYDRDKAGIENLLLEIMTKSSMDYSVDSLNYLIDRYGIRMDYNADYDYSYISFSSINKYFDETIDILMNLINKPGMSDDIIKKSKNKIIAKLKMKQHNIDEYIWDLLNERLYKEHPYYAFPDGKIETINAITKNDLIKHLDFLQKENRIIVSIVSGIKPQFIINKLKKNIAELKSSKQNSIMKSLSIPEHDTIICIKKDGLMTKYLASKFKIPSVNMDNYPIARISLSILSTKIYELLRTKHALTYATFIGASSRKANYGYFYVSTDYPDSALMLVKNEIMKYKQNGVKQEDIDNLKRRYITGYLMQNEQAIRKSFILGFDYIMHNDFNYTKKFINKLNTINTKQVKEFYNKYLNNFFILIIE